MTGAERSRSLSAPFFDGGATSRVTFDGGLDDQVNVLVLARTIHPSLRSSLRSLRACRALAIRDAS